MQIKERVGDMQIEERVVARPIRPPRMEELPAPVHQAPRPEVTVEHLLVRLVVVGSHGRTTPSPSNVRSWLTLKGTSVGIPRNSCVWVLGGSSGALASTGRIRIP